MSSERWYWRKPTGAVARWMIASVSGFTEMRKINRERLELRGITLKGPEDHACAGFLDSCTVRLGCIPECSRIARAAIVTGRQISVTT